ncbi:MAG: hypothetical protein ACOC93_00055 [Planctomycetota bacterium]
MTLTIRKCLLIAAIAGLMLLAHAVAIAGWLREAGVVRWAANVREEFLTGTAITILAALLVLLVGPGGKAVCGVCRRKASPRSNYCPHCGSRL